MQFQPPFEGSPKARAQANIAAIRMLKASQFGAIFPRADIQAALEKFSGWGSLVSLFDPNKADMVDLRDELSDLIGADKLERLGRSVLDSYYTPQPLIEAMWEAAKAGGFSGGEVLEPGCGAGHFRRFMPAKLADSVTVTGIERESIAASVARTLFRDMKVINESYEDCALVNDAFELVVGNVPFGQSKVFDPLHRSESAWSLHNYFLAKSIQKVRPGGLMIVVCSRYFLDAVNSECRSFVDRHADFLGAVRLPAGTFKASAGTNVVSDVLVFQRRQSKRPADVAAGAWTETGMVPCGSGQYRIGRYFIDHPANILGDLEEVSGPRGAELSVRGVIDDAFWASLAPALVPIAKQARPVVPGADLLSETVGGRPIIDPEKIECAGERIDGELIVVDAKRIAECVQVNGGRLFVEAGLVGKKATRARGLIGLAQSVKALLAAEAAGDGASMARLRAELNARYNSFVAANGPASNRANQLVFRGDPRNALVAALEDDFEDEISPARARQLGCAPRKAAWTKAAIFERPVNVPRPRVVPKTPEDALMRSLAEFGRVNLPEMAGWLSLDQDALITALGGRIFQDPCTAEWILSDIYLGGNVREKLRQAEDAVGQDERFLVNIHALREALPEDIPAADISAPLNAPWLPGDVLAAFFARILGMVLDSHPKIVGGEWLLDLPAGHGDVQTKVWGTERRSASNIIERVMNNRDLTVYDHSEVDGKTVRHFNADATAAVQAKADELREEWDGWIWADPERRRRLVRIYNDTHNSHAPTQFDGTFLLDDKGGLPGMSSAIRLRETQINAVWQGICTGSTLFDNVVGSGKTYACLAQAMEMRRMGLTNKAMVIVPNHLVLQWGAEAQRLYPNAKVLCAGRKDCTRDKRRRLFARIATGEWDVVICSHSSFKFIQAPKSSRFAMLGSMAREIAHAMVTTDEDAASYRRLQKRLENIRARMKRLMDAPAKDSAIDFDELGIDFLAVDEAQAYKNLLYFTSFYGIAGLGPSEGSQAAFDLFCKVCWMQDHSRYVTLLTGTPLSNSISEMFHFLRYLCYPTLEQMGIHTLDAWARVYAQPTACYELAVSGQYKLVTRFQEFTNVPELMRLYRHYTNVVTRSDLADQGGGWSVPRMRGGKPQMVICERSDRLAQYMDEILDRCNSLSGKDPREDNMLKIMTDARKAALDMRLVDPCARPSECDKVYQCAARVVREYRRWSHERGTQLVFCDLSTPAGANRQGGFSVYFELKRLLVAAGIPENEVAFIHDANTDDQKFSLQERVRQGLVRVLIGSTAKMGTGMNVQDRLVALHDLDAPWRPSDLEQRLGRIERYGNLLHQADPENFEIVVYRYGVERSLDARFWQTLEVKSRFIETIRKGSSERTIKDIGGETENAGAMKAALSGNPLILAHFEAASELDRLTRQQRAHARRQMAMEDRLQATGDWESRLENARAGFIADQQRLTTHPRPVWERAGQTHLDSCVTQMETDINAGFARMSPYHCALSADEAACIGHYRGFEVRIWQDTSRYRQVSILGDFLAVDFEYEGRKASGERVVSGIGLRKRIENVISRLESQMDYTEKAAEQTKIDRASMKKAIGQAFRHTARLTDLKAAVRELTLALSSGMTSLPPEASEAAVRLVSGASIEVSAPEITVDLSLPDIRIPSIIEHAGPVTEVDYWASETPIQQSLFG